MRKLLATLGFGAIVALGGAGAARAQSPVAGADAQERYALGEQAARDARWAEARDHFLAAWSLAPGPYTAGELGRVEVELGLDAAAEEHLALALAGLPEEEVAARALLRQSLERAHARASSPALGPGPLPPPAPLASPSAPPPAPRTPSRVEGVTWPAPGPVMAAGGVLAISSLAAGIAFSVAAAEDEAGAAGLEKAAALHYVVGGLVLTGTVTYVLWPRASRDAGALPLQAAPVVSNTGAGLVFVGSM